MGVGAGVAVGTVGTDNVAVGSIAIAVGVSSGIAAGEVGAGDVVVGSDGTCGVAVGSSSPQATAITRINNIGRSTKTLGFSNREYFTIGPPCL